jgi:hypothetical protein
MIQVLENWVICRSTHRLRRLALNVAEMFADPSKTLSQPASISYPEVVGNVNNNTNCDGVGSSLEPAITQGYS